MELIHLLGRFHPLVLHLPIGFLVMAALFEFLQRRSEQQSLQQATSIALLGTMISAILAAALGYLLSLEDGYAGELLDQHKWLGIGFALSSAVLYWLQKRRIKNPKRPSFFLPFLGFSFLLMSAAGHYGGMLTHGTNYLTEPLENLLGATDAETPQMDLSQLDSAVVFTQFIQPILKAKCTSCHNAGKLKGELMLHSIEGIKKGGENGAVLVARQVENSPLVQRIKLPKEEEEHMPPDGKKQITEDELALLEWWIAEGGDFEKKVGQYQQPDNIRTILEALVTPPNGIYALDIAPLSDRKLTALQEQGMPLFALSRESPFIEADFSGQDDLNARQLSQLKKSSQQLTKLDFSRSNCNDELLQIVTKLPHLTHLNLSKTKISNAGLRHLEGLEYLEYLNLFGTSINDSALVHLEQLPNLQRLYLWNTQVTEAGINQLQQLHPHLMIDDGREDDPAFAKATMKPPQILAEKEMFNDTVQVELKFNFTGANLYYTLDGTAPDTNALLYTAPLTLNQTTTIKAIAHKPGWDISEMSEKRLIKVKYRPKVVNLTTPNERYSGNGAKTLTDFTKGTMSFQDGSWLGYQKKHLEALLDLGKPVEVSRVTVSALENAGSWIFFPKGIKVWTSQDGKNYQSAASTSLGAPLAASDPAIKNFPLNFASTMARFVKVKVESNLVNPDWHPAPGEPCWIFVDEILVE